MDVTKTQNKSALDKVKGPDLFTTDLKKGFVWTVVHTKLVAIVVAVALIVGGGYAAITSMNESKERDAQAKYYDLEIAVSKKRAQFEGGANPDPLTPDEKQNVLKASGDLNKDYGSLVTDLNTFVEAHPNQVAGAMAALNLASLQNEYKDAATALVTLKKVGVPKGMVGALLQMETASLSANAGDCGSAIKIWETLVKQESAAFLKAEAKLKMGLCAESTGDVAKAESLYKEVEFESKDSSSGRAAKQYLRLLSQRAPSDAKAN